MPPCFQVWSSQPSTDSCFTQSKKNLNPPSLCFSHRKLPTLLYIQQVSVRTPCSLSTQPNCVHACVLSCFSRVQLFVMLWTVAHEAPLSMEFSRQKYWSGLPRPPSGDCPDPGIEPESLMSPALTDRFFTTSATSLRLAHLNSFTSKLSTNIFAPLWKLTQLQHPPLRSSHLKCLCTYYPVRQRALGDKGPHPTSLPGLYPQKTGGNMPDNVNRQNNSETWLELAL